MLVNSLNALNFVSFCGIEQKPKKEISVNFDKKENIKIPEIKKIQGEQGEVLNIKDENNLFEIENISNPKVGSKFILKPKDPKYKGLRILFKTDSILSSDDKKTNISLIAPENISFQGKVFGSIRKYDDGTSDKVMKKAYTDFWSKGMYDKVQNTSNNKDETSKIKEDYNFYVPSDGDGTRYKDVTTLLGGVTKPASQIPATLNGENMKLVQTTLTNFTKTSKLDDGCDFIEVKPAQGSACAFFEGIANGKIPTDKPVVFSWGDNFSDINVSKLLSYHEENNSDFTMLALPVTKKRVESLGAAKVNSNDDLTVNDFVEKPKGEIVDDFVIPNTKDECLGVVGPYVLSPKVLNWIKENYTKDPESFHTSKGYDFSEGVIGQLVDKVKQGEDFKVMVYKKEAADTWSDLGSEKDFSAEMKNLKNGAFKNLPLEIKESISDNIDKNGNISFDKESKKIFEDFTKEYNLNISNSLVYYEQ